MIDAGTGFCWEFIFSGLRASNLAMESRVSMRLQSVTARGRESSIFDKAGVHELGRVAKLALAMLAVFWATGVPPSSARTDRIRAIPRLVLWSWERREDLRFIDTEKIAVAYLDRTLELSGDGVVIRPRMQPLSVARAAVMIPVARIEIDRLSPPSLSAHQRSEASRLIAAMAAASPPAIQIDFDATASQRAFYRDLLAEVRWEIPRSTVLSITALASWCVDDAWLGGLEVDEVVPMLNRMGPDTAAVRSHLRRGGGLSAGNAVISIGISLDEPISDFPKEQRVYIFSPHRWTAREVYPAIAQATR